MPPKIREMTSKSTLPSNASGNHRRFTLMLSGEDTLDAQDMGGGPIKGLPHERFLLGKLVPIAPVLLLGQSTLTIKPQDEIACLQPVHLHASRDHLILMGQNQVDLTETESLELLKTALPLLEEDFQSPVIFHDKHYWFIPAGPFASLSSYSVSQSYGRNIDWWMPRDSDIDGVAKRWRKLQNEIQMLWHINSVNEKREARGMPSINSLWISGIGKLSDVDAPKVLTQSALICGQDPLLKGLAKYTNISYQAQIDSANLAGCFAWLEQPEHIWPKIEEALLSQAIDEFALIDFPKGLTRERIFTAKDLRKKSLAFWKKPQMLSWQEIIAS